MNASFTQSLHRLPKLLFLVIILGLFLGSVGIWWGVQPGNPIDWASDTILPFDVFQAASRLYQGGWYTRYPPFHYELLTVLYSPFFALHYLNIIDVTSFPLYTALLLLGRVLTLVMAIALVLLVYLWARELGLKELGAIFAAGITAFNPMFAFYSKTTNLDVPYTMWFVASMLFLTRAIKWNKLSDYAFLVTFATFAVCTKDQAYGLFVLIIPVVVYSIYKDARQQSSTPIAVGVRIAKNLLVLSAVAGALFITIYLIPLNLDGFVAHFKLIVGPASNDYRIFENSLAGHVQMLAQSFRQITFALSWWLLIICGIGITLVLRRKPLNRLVLLPIVPVISYYLFFISVVGYNYDRFFLPIMVSLSIYGGILLSDLWDLNHVPKLARRIPVLAVLASSFVYAASVNAMMIADSRYKALEWLETNVNQEDLVSGVGSTYYLPPLTKFNTDHLGRRPSVELVSEIEPTYIVASSIFSEQIFQEQTEGYRFFEALYTGELGYELAFQYQGKPVYNLLNRRNVYTNLDKINPEIQIFRRIN